MLDSLVALSAVACGEALAVVERSSHPERVFLTLQPAFWTSFQGSVNPDLLYKVVVFQGGFLDAK